MVYTLFSLIFLCMYMITCTQLVKLNCKLLKIMQ